MPRTLCSDVISADGKRQRVIALCVGRGSGWCAVSAYGRLQRHVRPEFGDAPVHRRGRRRAQRNIEVRHLGAADDNGGIQHRRVAERIDTDRIMPGTQGKGVCAVGCAVRLGCAGEAVARHHIGVRQAGPDLRNRAAQRPTSGDAQDRRIRIDAAPARRIIGKRRTEWNCGRGDIVQRFVNADTGCGLHNERSHTRDVRRGHGRAAQNAIAATGRARIHVQARRRHVRFGNAAQRRRSLR